MSSYWDVIFAKGTSNHGTFEDVYICTTPAYENDPAFPGDVMTIAGTEITVITVWASDAESAAQAGYEALVGFYVEEGIDPDRIGLARFRGEALRYV